MLLLDIHKGLETDSGHKRIQLEWLCKSVNSTVHKTTFSIVTDQNFDVLFGSVTAADEKSSFQDAIRRGPIKKRNSREINLPEPVQSLPRSRKSSSREFSSKKTLDPQLDVAQTPSAHENNEYDLRSGTASTRYGSNSPCKHLEARTRSQSTPAQIMAATRSETLGSASCVHPDFVAPSQVVSHAPKSSPRDWAQSAPTEACLDQTRRPPYPLYSSQNSTERPRSTVMLPTLAASEECQDVTHQLVHGSPRSEDLVEPTAVPVSPSISDPSHVESISSSWYLARYLQHDPGSGEDTMDVVEHGKQDDLQSTDQYLTPMRLPVREGRTEEMQRPVQASNGSPMMSAEDFWLWDDAAKGYYHRDQDTQGLVWYEPLD